MNDVSDRKVRSVVIILNGTSSSGKSTLAKSLQNILKPTFLHVSLDSFGEMFPEEFYDRPDGFKIILLAMISCVKTLSSEGYNIIIDGVLEEKDSLSTILENLQNAHVLTVGVYCNLEILKIREVARSDRRIGMAGQQLQYIHYDHKYDFEVDTSHKAASALASEIIAECGATIGKYGED